ncbi:putative glutathione-specific gamma-glutamylcyclotransferase 2 isoform X2 [Rhipicephalus sanguineus]|uniref:putative glutathione-specific gamma-glutamylcyclotransferase 2 isoform X2 n=1 Tax=Rhipicephalus sanguineus TaxID=34632 RepID=UPI0020C312D9|nr:putative glutathione-specific gamma-glutamylcyclotransferase 2 isoform X2 [Rhipicephalus sanguineus]
MGSSSGIWVFGYGSLVWNPGFEFVRSQIGYIRGYDRRFWQGNDKHRGTPEKGQVWGRAFLLREDDASARDSLGYLDEREAQLGGYSVSFVQFRPRDPREEPFPALVYIATANNPLYLGPASSVQLADEVMAARGFCGANAEYVLKLARFMREEVPDCWDDHLFTLESLLKTRLKDSWEMLQEMSAYEPPMSAWEQLRRFSLFSDNGEQEERDVDAEAGPAAVGGTSDFASSVPSRKLRCLDM